MEYPALNSSQAADLARVARSTDGPLHYAPCQVTLTSGEVLDRVYVLDAPTYMTYWGVDPKDDPAKLSVAIEDVAHIATSPLRLPAHFATRIYAAGESGMGYTIFTVVTRDGKRHPYVGGNAIDFPMWPVGFDPAEIADVQPHVGRETFRDRGPAPSETIAPYYWCLYAT